MSGASETDELKVVREVFGDSDSDCDFDENGNNCWQVGHEKVFWEEVKEINGLWLCRKFLSPQQQNHLLNCIEQERWFEDPSTNQAMRFGDLPEWLLKLCELVQCAIFSYDGVCKICDISASCVHKDEKGSPLSPELLWREPLFDQMIANAYEPGEGICAHVDLLRFEDGIAIISLESACVMHFTHQSKALKKIPVLLMAGDMVLMSGEARYNWLHEINRKPGNQIWNGEEIIQRRRISITLRRLSQSI